MDNRPITARWPIFRTNPAGTVKAGGMAILTAILSVLILGPMIGFVLTYAPEVFGPFATWAITVQTIGMFLMLSFLLSWAALIVAVPIGAACATHGIAGWSTALLAGSVAGLITALVVEGELGPEPLIAYVATAVILAMMCWVSVRLVHPEFIGFPSDLAPASGS